MEYLQQGTLDPAKYQDNLKDIHTKFVRSTINSLDVNPILGAAPPPIVPSEKRLSRIERTTLAQLRSGDCQPLNNYLLRDGRSTSALCPECLYRRHTVNHLFECDARPRLSSCDLWNNPGAVSSFMQTLPSFSLLLPPDPPLEPPPPEPPPGHD